MKIVKKIIVVFILFMLCSGDFLQAQCTCIESPGSLNANQLALCENFESYSNGSSFPFNNASWTFWPGTGTSARIQTAPNSNSKALLVQHNGFTSPDLLLKLGNRTTGRYRLSWQMYIPKGKTAYYSIQHAESAGLWAYEVGFENGIGTLSRFGLPVTKFPYITGGWNKVMQIIDITADNVELWINDEYVDSWRFNTGRETNSSYIFGTYPLAAINFKGATNASYYVDNICLWRATPSLPSNVGPICIKNGQSISGGESIIKNYNLYTEREYSNENCRNICSFAGLNVKNSLKYDNQNRVPASRIDDASVLPNQVINLPCLKDRVLTQKTLRGQIYPFTATTTDLSIELRFQLGFAGSVQIALVECNENLNFPCQLDENTDGLSFYFKVQPGKIYNIIVVATETVEFLIDISTVIQPKICVLTNQDIGTPCICKEANTILSQSTTLTNIKTSDDSGTKRVFPEINRDYLGGEKAFRIILERPSMVNFSLRSTDQGYSMFLAGSDCADNLLALNSTPDNGGTAAISKALEAGVYHLVVDQLRANRTSTFQLTYTFSVLDPVSRLSNSSCPTNPNNIHQVSIRSSPLLLNTDVLTIKDRIYLVSTRNTNNREANAINWNGQEINFTLQEDASTDNLNCGYVEGDLIEFVIIRQDKIYSVKPIFQLENGTDITASSQFKKGGKSLITGFLSNLNVSNLGVGSIPSLSANERIFDVEINSTGVWRIQRVNPNKPAWIEFNLTSSSGIKDVSFKVLRNQSTQSRTDTILVINDQGFYKSIVITQPGCTGPSVDAGQDQSICAGQNVNLTASGVGTITWENPGTISNPRLTATPNATQTFTVYATINGCTATDQVTVNVLQKPNANAGPDQTICSGVKALLSASGGGTYAWSNGSTAAQFEVNPTVTTTYTLTVTSQLGCAATDQVVVVVNRTFASAGTDRSICRGSSILLEASGGGVYSWSTGETASSITVSPDTSKVYQVTVSKNNCSATASVKVTVIPLPQASAGLPQTICLGQSTNLSASGGGTYLWNTNASTQQITVSPTESTDYTVTVTQNGCSRAAQVRVTVNSATANAGPDQSICAGQSAVLTASGGGTYKWNTNATASSITVVPGSTETYTVTVTQDGCEASDQLTVTVRPLPIANAGPDQSICAGQSALLTASGGSTYKWNTNATASSITVVPSSTETFTVTVTQNGCDATDQLTVAVRPLPIANAGPDQSICAGQSALLTASGGSTYKWNTNTTASSITVVPGSTETYTVTVTQDGCDATDQLTVTVRPLPIANAGPDQSICAGQSALLTASGGSTYKWNTNATASSITVVPGSTETYTVTVTQNGCEATDQLTVTVRPLPIANAGPDQSICAGQSALLTASGGSTYKWNTNTTASSITVAPGSTETYTVTVTQNGCDATDQLTVTVRPLPIANAGPDQSICAGQSALLTASGGSTYKWNTNATASSITVVPGSTETYTVTVTQDGCDATDQLTVTVRPLPIANAGPDQSICAGQRALLTASGGGTYKWNTNATASSITVVPGASETYTVTVTQNGCEATDQLTVTVRPLPVANAGPDLSICAKQSAVLNATGGNTYKWSNNATTASITISLQATQVFTVTVTQNECESVDEVRVTVRPLPNANAGPDQSICVGQSTVLTASGGGTYKWSTNATTSTISVSPAATQIYTLTVTQNDCESIDQVSITVNPNPSIKKDSSQFKAGLKSFIAVSVTGGKAPYQYQWFRNDTLVSTQEDLVGLKTGIYKLSIQDANGCSAGYGPELFIITSARDVTGLLDLKIYPNPTQGRVRIEGKFSKKETVQVRILEATGKYIWKSDTKIANEFLYTPDLSNLAKGIYIIQLDVSGEFVYRKLVVH